MISNTSCKQSIVCVSTILLFCIVFFSIIVSSSGELFNSKLKLEVDDCKLKLLLSNSVVHKNPQLSFLYFENFEYSFLVYIIY